jgi:hypothetical protein
MAEQFEGDFLAAITDGVIDLAEAAPADPPLDRVTFERSITTVVSETCCHKLAQIFYSPPDAPILKDCHSQ